MAKKICVTARKGGVGKSMIAINLAGFLANDGYSVLIVCEDPQEDLTTKYLSETDYDEINHYSLTDAIQGTISPKDAIYTTHEFQRYGYDLEMRKLSPMMQIKRKKREEERLSRKKIPNSYYTIDIIPAGSDTADVDTDDPAFVKNLLADVMEEYDYVIFDTPPAANDATLLSYIASDYLIVPMCDEQSSETFVKTYQGYEWAKTINTDLEFLGIVINRYNRVRSISKHIADLFYVFDLPVFDSRIYDSSAVVNSRWFGLPLASFTETDPPIDFYKFYKEVVEKTGD